MNRTVTPSAPHILGFLGAGLLVSASAALAAFYGFTTGSHVHVALGTVLAAAAVGGELLKPLSVAAAIDAFGRWQVLRGLAAVALAAVCLVYSTAAELSFAAAMRGDAEAERVATADAQRDARADRRRAEAELESLPPARPAAELEPLISKLKATPGANRCEATPDGPVSRKVCGEVAELQAEAARAERRAELEGAIRDATERSKPRGHAVGHADPLAGAVAAYSAALGWSWKPEDVSPWLSLIFVAFLELGSALSVVVARSVGGPSEPSAPSAAPLPQAWPLAPGTSVPAAPVAPAAPARPEAPTEAATPSVPTRPETRNDDDGDAGGTPAPAKAALPPRARGILRLIEQHGGALESSQRRLAHMVGTSKTELGRTLAALADAGVVIMATGRNGTRLQLAGA